MISGGESWNWEPIPVQVEHLTHTHNPQPTTYIQRHLALSSVTVSPSRMDRITILLLLGGILVTCAQKPRFFKTKFDDCGKIRISFLELKKKTSKPTISRLIAGYCSCTGGLGENDSAFQSCYWTTCAGKGCLEDTWT